MQPLCQRVSSLDEIVVGHGIEQQLSSLVALAHEVRVGRRESRLTRSDLQ